MRRVLRLHLRRELLMTDAPDPGRYEVISLYDSRIIRRGLTWTEAREFCREMNRRTDHGVTMKEQR